MARFPGATWDGEHSPRTPMQRYDIVCIHTIVGRAPAHAAHLSTFMDGRKPHQSRDTAYRSAANLDGNHRVLAIENEDDPRRPVTDWAPLTDSQVEDCAQFLAWAHKVHGVPLQLAPDSKPGSRGLAYHRQGVDGNFGPGTPFKYPGRVAGGERWSSSAGKVCPTDARIAQLPRILARAIEITNGGADDMADKKTQETLAAILKGVNRANDQVLAFRRAEYKRDMALRKLVVETLKLARAGGTTDKTVLAKLAELEASLTDLADPDAEGAK